MALLPSFCRASSVGQYREDYAILAAAGMTITCTPPSCTVCRLSAWRVKVFQQFVPKEGSANNDRLSHLTEVAVMDRLGVPPEREGTVSR